MHRDVFGYLMKNSSFLHPRFPHQNQFVLEVISNTRHSISSQYQKYYASYFQLSSRYLICDETLCLVFDILLNNHCCFFLFKVVQGSTNRYSVFTRRLNPRLQTRYLRISPQYWNGHPCLRVDFMGCAPGEGI